MTIIYNGGNNPSRVYCNGTDLDYVCARHGSSGSFEVVWSKSHPIQPPDMSLVTMSGSNIQMWLRDLTYSNTLIVVYTDTGQTWRYIEYTSASSSFDFKWDKYRFEGYLHPTSDVFMSFGKTEDGCSISGVDGTVGYDRIAVSIPGTMGLDFVASSVSYPDGDSRLANEPIANIDFSRLSCSFEKDYYPGIGPHHYNMASFNFANPSTSYTTSIDRWLYTAYQGVVFQKGVTVQFWKRLA